MKGFIDIEGTEICEGDEILITENNYGTTTAGMRKSKVLRTKGERMYFESSYGGESYMIKYETESRVLVLKGEFKKYNKEELINYAS